MSGAEGEGHSPFERLHPAIQYHVVNSLGWPGLRPLQEQSVIPVLAGHHALLIAPTAGGKTEAAMLPVLSRMLSEEWQGLSVLYICPIKALLNNLESRLSYLAGLLGRSVQLWHGDIGQGEKNRVERDLPDILLTTPESLEGILIGSRRDQHRLLDGVRCVVIDELHAFAGDDRGWHLLALLERIQRLGAIRPQRIGLSATVGEPKALLEWLAGHCSGNRTLVHIQAPPAAVDLQIDFVGSLVNAASLISQLHRGEKRLVFCDSRSRCEELSIALRALGVDVYVSHAALSADTRRQAEQAFSERQNCVIVATSTLELGLDVGDLDRVIQIDAPGSVASFLQRLGRTGRREGSRRNMLFIATRDDGLLESLAIIELFRQGYVEPVSSPALPYHLLVQQLFAMLFEHGLELRESSYLEAIGSIPGFSEMLEADWVALKEHLVLEGYLIQTGHFLTLGHKAERAFKGRGIADLCVSFDSPRFFSVFQGNTFLGNVDPLSVTMKREGPVAIALGGRSWLLSSVDWTRDRVYVEPAEVKGASRWLGESRGVSRVIANQVRSVVELPPNAGSPQLTKRSFARLVEICEAQEGTLTLSPIRTGDGEFEWWTYQGLAFNTILAGRISAAGGSYGLVGSYSVRFRISEERLKCIGGWSGIQSVDPLFQPDSQSRMKFSEMLPSNLLLRMQLKRVISRAGV